MFIGYLGIGKSSGIPGLQSVDSMPWQDNVRRLALGRQRRMTELST